METAAAFLLFARHPADVLLLEVGLGGRLDATNVVERPLASVITRVSIDHREFLGDTIEQIAAEKAGILKPGVPAVVSSQAREALAVIERQAARVRAPLAHRGRDLDRDRGTRPPRLSGWRRAPRSAGAEALRPPSIRECRRGDRGAAGERAEASRRRIRGRHDRAPTGRRACNGWRNGRLAALLPPEAELWLDGGHNADGGRAIAAALADLEERVSRPLVLIVGMLSSKDSAGFLKNFSGLARRVIAVPIHQDKTVPAAALADIARDVGLPALARDDLESALDTAGKLDLQPAPRILITGSLYLAGEVLAANGTPPQ